MEGYNMCSMSSNGLNKRKRTKNTSQEQFEIYLEAMENDYVLRSNTINPTLGPNYLQEQWEQLTLHLNAVGDGPMLTAEEWKKRFTDWKYAIKAKKRKIDAHRSQTGGGPMIQNLLSPLEERALDVWGRVTVAGADVTRYEGLNEKKEESIIIQVVNQTDSTEEVQKENKTRKIRNREKKKCNKPLSSLAENLLKITHENIENQNCMMSIIQTFAQDYCSLQKENLEFKIKKFKYLHPDFTME